MKKTDIESSNYSYKEELRLLLGDIGDLVNNFNKSLTGSETQLKKITTNIDKKMSAIEKNSASIEEQEQKIAELVSLKSIAKNEIKELQARKRAIGYTDSDVKKMEIEDIEASINVKNGKIAKIEAKAITAKEKVDALEESVKTLKAEIKDLENEKSLKEETVYKNGKLVELLNCTLESLNDEALKVVKEKYVPFKEEIIEEPEESEEAVNDDFSVVEGDILDIDVEDDSVDLDEPSMDNDSEPEIVLPKWEEVVFEGEEREETEKEVQGEELVITIDEDDEEMPLEDEKNIVLDEPSNEIIVPLEEEEEEVVEEETATPEEVLEESEETEAPKIIEPSLVSEPINLPENMPSLESALIQMKETTDTTNELANASSDYEKLLVEVFENEIISFEDFDETTRKRMIEGAEKVIRNVVVLKKHNVPLNLTLMQPDIYFNVDSQDLDDLINIITGDIEDNGMGFSIEYIFYVLNELSRIDVDEFIDVYNNEIENITNKTGLIYLLKKVNPNLGNFELNKKTNKETLRVLGVNTTEAIEVLHPEFINLDNPLFINLLNTFDKDDLTNKLNSDVNLVPKIFNYWKNN